ncbi:EamA family transporter [Candidatus Falkowbacteria bacterium]|jgi:drug/metabolite transporter (DMT)-like permease|nr:EamA family transporter [Candidatus Falkowbacteria bacterium]
MNHPLFYCVVAGFFFAVWPMIMRVAQMNLLYGATVMGFSTFVATLIALLISPQGDLTFPGMKPVMLGLAAGVINAFGFLAYVKLITNPEWEVSKMIPAMTALLVLFGALGGWLFFKEPLTANKGIGVVLAILAVWFLR